MTVSTTSNRIVFAGNGATTSFPTGFRVDQAADLVVIYTDASGNNTTLTTGQYSTDGQFGSAFPNGPTVTYSPLAGPIATGTALTLYRSPATTQLASINNQGAMWPATIEGALDRIVMIVQGFIDGMKRGLRIPVTDGTTLNELPAATQRANGYLGFDGSGQPTVLAAPAGSTPISVAMAAVVDQSTLALARTAMGAAGPSDNNAFIGTNTHTGAETFTGTVDVSTGSGRLKTPTRTAGDSGTDAASTSFVATAIANGKTASLGGTILRSYLAGLGTSNNATPNTKIDVAAGVCADGTNALMLALAATTTLDCTTVGANGLDTGSLTSTTWYHLFVIGKADGSAFAVLASTSLSSPTFPSGYTLKRRIASFLTDGSAHILAYIQDGDYFRWKATPAVTTDTNPGTSAVLKAVTVPPGVTVLASLNVAQTFATSGSAGFAQFSDPAATDEAPSATAAPLANMGAVNNGAANLNEGGLTIRTNTSQQVRYRVSASGASDTIRIATLGWTDRRGRDA